MSSTMTNRASTTIAEAGNQAQHVADDLRRQFADASSKTKSEFRTQADERAAQAARGLRALSSQATALVQGRTEEAADLTSLLSRLGSETEALANRLEMRKSSGLLEDMSRFGRRQPMMFLTLALGAGVLAGRALRVGTAVSAEDAATPNALGTAPSNGADDRRSTMPDEVRV